MTDLHQQAILRLFWHRTRRQFVPLTMMEIERRAVYAANVKLDRLFGEILALVRAVR